MFQRMPSSPSLARVMPAASVLMTLLSLPAPASALRLVLLRVGVGVVREHLLGDLRLVLAVGALHGLDEVEVLHREIVDAELEGAAQGGEIGLLQGLAQRVLVRRIALRRLQGAVDESRRVVGL